MNDVSPHARANQAYWNEWASDYVEDARKKWATDEQCWGIWEVPEERIGILPDVDGLDVIELGCGTAYFSAWFARRGARPVGVDLSEAQLETARAMQTEHGLHFPLIHASAEQVPLEDASFDFAFSEYGASLWCDPHVWIPEAARLLRPGGTLLFLTSGLLSSLCAPDSEEPVGEALLRPLFGLTRIDWSDDNSVSFYLPHGDWISLLRDTGFEIERLHELQVPEDASPTRYEWMPREWARCWPCEEIWLARKTSSAVDKPSA
jgi:SAM-dependent methyltransferase